MRVCICLCWLALSVGCAEQYVDHDAEVTLTVKDEWGVPVEDAMASVSFYREDGSAEHLKGLVDVDGVFQAHGRTRSAFKYYAEKEGWYGLVGVKWSHREFHDFYKRPQPKIFRQSEEIIMRKVVCPVPMYVREVSSSQVPSLKAPYGWDFIKSDWVAPYGSGEVVDAYVTIDAGFDRKNRENNFTKLHIFFLNGGGIQKTKKVDSDSELFLEYLAPIDGYQEEIVPDRGHDLFYFVKIKRGDRWLYGKIVNGLGVGRSGGKKYGQVRFYINCYINPDGTRNMECDTSNKGDLYRLKGTRGIEVYHPTAESSGVGGQP